MLTTLSTRVTVSPLPMTFVSVIDRGSRRASTPKSFTSSPHAESGDPGRDCGPDVQRDRLPEVLGTSDRARDDSAHRPLTARLPHCHRSTWLTDIARLCTAFGSRVDRRSSHDGRGPDARRSTSDRFGCGSWRHPPSALPSRFRSRRHSSPGLAHSSAAIWWTRSGRPFLPGTQRNPWPVTPLSPGSSPRSRVRRRSGSPLGLSR